jgi:hypothetical protein
VKQVRRGHGELARLSPCGSLDRPVRDEATRAAPDDRRAQRLPRWPPARIGYANRRLLSPLTDDFTVECPAGSGKYVTLFEVARDISRRLAGILVRDEHGRRPVHGGIDEFQDDPHWRDLILFYEYFHGDNGAGLGASHQTGWTGVVARLLDPFGRVSATDALQTPKERRQARVVREQVCGKG